MGICDVRRSDLRAHFFVDEAGNFDFNTKQGASRYFILTSVTMRDCKASEVLLDLRRELNWEGVEINGAFHATTNKQAVRDRVFDVIASMDIEVDATIFEKRKAQPHLHDMIKFYKLAWYQHAKEAIPNRIEQDEDLHVIAASIGTKKQRAQVASAIKDVVNQCGRQRASTRVNHWPAESDPCLQIADYCCWAIQRKWEGSDDRSHVLIDHLIRSEYEMWSRSSVYQY
jgi:hypothetical protein